MRLPLMLFGSLAYNQWVPLKLHHQVLSDGAAVVVLINLNHMDGWAGRRY